MEIVEAQNRFMHLNSVCTQVLHVTRTRNTGKERAVWNGGKDFAILNHEDVSRSSFGDISHRIGNQCVTKPFRTSLHHHAGVVGVETPSLGVYHVVFQHRAAETGPGQGCRGIGGGHRDLLKADGKACRILERHNTQLIPCQRPIHRANINCCVPIIGLEPFTNHLDHFVGFDGRGDHQRIGRPVDTFAMRPKIWGQPVKHTRAIKHGSTEPSTMIGCLDHGQVPVVPRAIVKRLDIGACGHVRVLF